MAWQITGLAILGYLVMGVWLLPLLDIARGQWTEQKPHHADAADVLLWPIVLARLVWAVDIPRPVLNVLGWTLAAIAVMRVFGLV